MDNKLEQSFSSRNYSKKSRLQEPKPKGEQISYKVIKLENNKFITFENLVMGEEGGIEVKVVRTPPQGGLDEPKKSKMKPSQLLNFEEQVFRGKLVFEKIQKRVSSLFIKETPKKNRFEFIKKIQKTFESHQNSVKFGEVTKTEKGSEFKEFFSSDSFNKGLCFRVDLDHEGPEGEDLFTCRRMYLKLYIKSENFEFFGKNLFHKYNMNKIINIISPLKRFPEKSMESMFEDYFEAFFEKFQMQLREFGRKKMWVKETFVQEKGKENVIPEKLETNLEENSQKDFYEAMSEHGWLLKEFLEVTS